MEMRINEGGRNEIALGIDCLERFAFYGRRNFCDETRGAGNVQPHAAIGKRRIGDEKIKHDLAFAFPVGHHQGAGVGGAARHDDECDDGQDEG